MWYLSKVLKYFRLFPVVIISIVSAMVLYPVFSVWFEYPELLLLLLMSWICSLYLLLNVRPLCPMYFSVQSRRFIWWMPLLLYLSVCAWGFNIFCIVFCVRKAIFIRVSWKSLVILLTSLPLYVKVTHFIFWWWEPVICVLFCGEVVF
jgi:hypothetical protein